MDRLGAKPRKARGRNREIRQQPMGARCSGGGKSSDQALKLIRAKAIEEKVGDKEVESSRWWRVFQRICVDELNLIERKIGGLKAALRQRLHALARIDTSDFRLRVLSAECRKELSRAFAENQHGFGRGQSPEVKCAAILQVTSRKQRFHPPIMWSDPVETHPSETPVWHEPLPRHQK